MNLLGWQAWLALFLAAFVGPGLMLADLANNALPFTGAPFSRTEYVLGKMSVLVTLMSLMTWVPGLLCFGLEGFWKAGNGARDNARLAVGLFLGAGSGF